LQARLEVYRRLDIELLAGEATYGRMACADDSRESALIKIAVSIRAKTGPWCCFSREISQAATGMALG